MFTSFRDPAGSVLVTEDRVLRSVNMTGEANLNAFLASRIAKGFVESGVLVRTTRVGSAGPFTNQFRPERQGRENRVTLEHERIPFPNFPYEWPPEMLFQAASLTLDLAEQALTEGFGLKDATPYNILFRGTRPVFVDLLSFEQRDPRDPIWLPYAQFQRTFLLPLLINRFFSVDLHQLFLTRCDGLNPEEVYRLCGAWRKLRRPFLTLVSIPVWLEARSPRKSALYNPRRLKTTSDATHVLGQLFRFIRRQLKDVEPVEHHTSKWQDYMNPRHDFDMNYVWKKELFVRQALDEFRARRVLDVGCNTGYFSRSAARVGATVVAIDRDPAVVGDLWREVHSDGADILPLVVDFARPSPSVGWRNSENLSFLERAHGSFDLLLMLAIVHHLLVSERIPLEEILGLAADLTSDLLVIEFVAPDDPMFTTLTRGRESLFDKLTNESFREACTKRFHIIRSQQLDPKSRWLYLLKKK
ncbi:MAG TPA: methyltransferase domain-containing protein [Pyrinomonadaceae bacterium]|nr:methyltransferase domain-containing protein [Pyrinomonadaceae bacterium]